MFLITLVNALFASTFTLGKGAMAYISPYLFVAIRMTVAGALLLLYWSKFGAKQVGSLKKNIWNIVGYSLLGIAVSFIAEFWSYANGLSSAKGGLINSFAPFISAIVSYFFLSERLSKKKWIALGIGFVGFLPIIAQDVDTSSLAGIFSASITDFVFFISVVTYSLGWIFMRKLVQDGFSPLFVNGIAMVSSGLICFVISYLTGSFETVTSWTAVAWYEASIILIGSVFCYNMFGYLLKRYTVTFFTLTGLTLPIFTAVFGYVFLDEKITWHFLVSFIIILISMYLFYKEELKEILHKNVLHSSN